MRLMHFSLAALLIITGCKGKDLKVGNQDSSSSAVGSNSTGSNGINSSTGPSNASSGSTSAGISSNTASGSSNTGSSGGSGNSNGTNSVSGSNGTSESSGSSDSTGSIGSSGFSGSTGSSGLSGSTGSSGFSGSTGSNGSSGSTGGVAQFCSSVSQAYCDLSKACGIYDPQADCNLVGNAWSVPCNDSSLSFDSAAAATCLNNIQQAATNSDCTSPVLNASGVPCPGVFSPATQEGGACQPNSFDCIQRPDGGLVNCVDTVAGTCNGICSAGSTLGESCGHNSYDYCIEGTCSFTTGVCVPFADGGPCQGIDQGCEPGVEYCSRDGGTAFCSPRVPTGGECVDENGNNCVPGDFCELPPDGGSQTYCVATQPLGQSCSLDGGPACGDGTCINGICEPYAVPLGGNCNSQVFCIDGYCNSPNGGQGICVALPVLGQACNLPQVPCEGVNLACVNNICQAVATVGQTCSNINGSLPCRFGDYCDSQNRCQLLAAIGDSCDRQSGSPCISGYCDSTSHCAVFKPAGAACNPVDLDCSVFRSTVDPGDGGAPITVDGYCNFDTDAGGNVCFPSVLCP